MPLGVAQESTQEDDAAFEALREADANAAGDNTPASGEPSGEASGAATGAEGATGQAGEGGESGKPGNPHAALRAARRAERRALQEAERLRQENERLKQQVPAQATPQPDDQLTDDDVAAIETDFPAISKLAKTVKKLTASAPAAAPAAAAPASEPEPEFVPRQLPPELQDVVDTIPDLLGWQNDPDQTAFELAVAADRLLVTHPKWKDKPLAERMAEVTRRVNAELAEVSPGTTSSGGTDPVEEAINNAPSRTPRSPSEIGGGGGRQDTTNDLSRFQRMSDDDMYAELSLRG